MTLRSAWLLGCVALMGCGESSSPDLGAPWFADAGSGSPEGPLGDGGAWTAFADALVVDGGAAAHPDVPRPPPPPTDAGIRTDARVPGDASPADAAVPGDASPADAAVTCEAIADRTPVTLYLSADDSNSMASPVIARRLIALGQRVPAALVRPWEFLNYYNVPYEPAAPGRVRVVPQLRPGTAPGSFDLQVGVASEARTAAQVRPMTVTFVLDTSGSMAGGQRIERERAVVRAIASSLRPGDIVSAVTWSTTQRVALAGHRVAGPDDPTLLGLAESLSASGGTDLSGGLRAGYDLARSHYGEGRLNRVVVISDGEANVGVTDQNLIAEASHFAEREEIYLVGVGVGDGFNDTLMDTVTDRGRGAYVFVDTDAEATEMFGRRFVETMDLAVRAVRLELTLPWYLRVAEFHGEQISTNPREVDPQHLAPNDAMVFSQVLRPCSPAMVDLDDAIVARATFASRDRVAADERVAVSFRQLLDGGDAALRRGRAIVAWARALQGAVDLDTVDRLLREAPGADTDPALREIAALAARYRALRPF